MFIYDDGVFTENRFNGFHPIFFHPEEYENILVKINKKIEGIKDTNYYIKKENKIYGGMTDYEKVIHEIDRLMAFDYNDSDMRERVRYELYSVIYEVDVRHHSKNNDYTGFLKMLVMLDIFAGVDVNLYSVLNELYQELVLDKSTTFGKKRWLYL